jgi:hypothetical protein
MIGESGGADWDDLNRELGAWQAEGLTATFWWRDDDAAEVTDALEKMFEISDSTETPLALAVIPARAGSRLRDRLSRRPRVRVLQHGFAHHNHQPPKAKKSEFGAAREAGQAADELGRGFDLLSPWPSFLPVFVPPWNRMERRFMAVLPKIGLTGISCFRARPARFPQPGLFAVNSHIDIINSGPGGRRFIGPGAALQAIIDHLSSRRLGRVDREEPSGILSHHLDHGGDSWAFLQQIIILIGNHPAARWLEASEVFRPETGQETL